MHIVVTKHGNIHVVANASVADKLARAEAKVARAEHMADAFSARVREASAAEAFGPAAVDTVMCQRCNSTARWSDLSGGPRCPRCGLLVHSREATGSVVVDRGYHPVSDETVTGYYIDNPHPHAGLREPAWNWVEGVRDDVRV